MLIVVTRRMEVELLVITLHLRFDVAKKELEGDFRAHRSPRAGGRVESQATLIAVLKEIGRHRPLSNL